ncbi:hypothetical protein [Hydrogenophaga sp. SL48]|uniref:hypothetical protein n=1 Tax=Hydrogenophaga sp. SL48 TaxID=2806347 RepID=UPI001F3F508E|nr:hypothetical protein [Hydrogenophaga sp. SL48]UJW81611.1 hypothetical protein IM738_02455 [Hydrogenophaga sp. SL48]
MRSAPSVMYPVGRCSFYAGLLLASGSMGLLVVAWGARMGPSWSVAFGVLLWMLWGAIAVVSWRHSPVGRLQWDALAAPVDDLLAREGAWLWHSTAYQDGVVLLRVEPVQDFQRWMLLRLHNPEGARTWVWVARASDPQRWDDLRRAVVAHG